MLRDLCAIRHDTTGREWLWPKADTETWKVVHQELAEIPEILALCPKHRVCIQAGGNGGLWVKPLGEHFDVVYTFEPDPLMFMCLAWNVDAPNVVKTQAALGFDQGFVEIDRWQGPRNPGANRIARIPGGSIPRVAIDDYGYEAVDLIQLDIEGYELNALKGAAATIDHCRPVIVVELRNHASHYGASDEAIRSEIARHGYRLAKRMFCDEVYVPQERA